MNAKELLSLKQTIEEGERDLERSKGELAAVTKNLKEEHGLKTISAAKMEVAKLLAEVEELEEERNEKIEKIRRMVG